MADFQIDIDINAENLQQAAKEIEAALNTESENPVEKIEAAIRELASILGQVEAARTGEDNVAGASALLDSLNELTAVLKAANSTDKKSLDNTAKSATKTAAGSIAQASAFGVKPDVSFDSYAKTIRAFVKGVQADLEDLGNSKKVGINAGLTVNQKRENKLEGLNQTGVLPANLQKSEAAVYQQKEKQALQDQVNAARVEADLEIIKGIDQELQQYQDIQTANKKAAAAQIEAAKQREKAAKELVQKIQDNGGSIDGIQVPRGEDDIRSEAGKLNKKDEDKLAKLNKNKNNAENSAASGGNLFGSAQSFADKARDYQVQIDELINNAAERNALYNNEILGSQAYIKAYKEAVENIEKQVELEQTPQTQPEPQTEPQTEPEPTPEPKKKKNKSLSDVINQEVTTPIAFDPLAAALADQAKATETNAEKTEAAADSLEQIQTASQEVADQYDKQAEALRQQTEFLQKQQAEREAADSLPPPPLPEPQPAPEVPTETPKRTKARNAPERDLDQLETDRKKVLLGATGFGGERAEGKKLEKEEKALNNKLAKDPDSELLQQKKKELQQRVTDFNLRTQLSAKAYADEKAFIENYNTRTAAINNREVAEETRNQGENQPVKKARVSSKTSGSEKDKAANEGVKSDIQDLKDIVTGLQNAKPVQDPAIAELKTAVQDLATAVKTPKTDQSITTALNDLKTAVTNQSNQKPDPSVTVALNELKTAVESQNNAGPDPSFTQAVESIKTDNAKTSEELSKTATQINQVSENLKAATDRLSADLTIETASISTAYISTVNLPEQKQPEPQQPEPVQGPKEPTARQLRAEERKQAKNKANAANSAESNLRSAKTVEEFDTAAQQVRSAAGGLENIFDGLKAAAEDFAKSQIARSNAEVAAAGLANETAESDRNLAQEIADRAGATFKAAESAVAVAVTDEQVAKELVNRLTGLETANSNLEALAREDLKAKTQEADRVKLLITENKTLGSLTAAEEASLVQVKAKAESDRIRAAQGLSQVRTAGEQIKTDRQLAQSSLDLATSNKQIAVQAAARATADQTIANSGLAIAENSAELAKASFNRAKQDNEILAASVDLSKESSALSKALNGRAPIEEANKTSAKTLGKNQEDLATALGQRVADQSNYKDNSIDVNAVEDLLTTKLRERASANSQTEGIVNASLDADRDLKTQLEDRANAQNAAKGETFAVAAADKDLVRPLEDRLTALVAETSALGDLTRAAEGAAERLNNSYKGLPQGEIASQDDSTDQDKGTIKTSNPNASVETRTPNNLSESVASGVQQGVASAGLDQSIKTAISARIKEVDIPAIVAKNVVAAILKTVSSKANFAGISSDLNIPELSQKISISISDLLAEIDVQQLFQPSEIQTAIRNVFVEIDIPGQVAEAVQGAFKGKKLFNEIKTILKQDLSLENIAIKIGGSVRETLDNANVDDLINGDEIQKYVRQALDEIDVPKQISDQVLLAFKNKGLFKEVKDILKQDLSFESLANKIGLSVKDEIDKVDVRSLLNLTDVSTTIKTSLQESDIPGQIALAVQSAFNKKLFNEVKAIVKQDLSFDTLATRISETIQAEIEAVELSSVLDSSLISSTVESALVGSEIEEGLAEAVRSAFKGKKLFNEVKAIVKQDLSFDVVANKISESIKTTLAETDISNVLDTSTLLQTIQTALLESDIPGDLAEAVKKAFSGKKLFNDVKALVKQDLSFDIVANKISESIKDTLEATQIDRVIDTTELLNRIQNALVEADIVGDLTESVRNAFKGKKLFNEVKTIVKQDLSFEVIANKISTSVKDTLEATNVDQVLNTDELSVKIQNALVDADIVGDLTESVRNAFKGKKLFNEVKAIVKEDLSFEVIANKINESVRETLANTQIDNILDTSTISQTIQTALKEADVPGEISEKVRQAFGGKKLFNEVKALVKEDLSFEVIANKINESVRETLANTEINNLVDTSNLSEAIRLALVESDVVGEIVEKIRSVFGAKKLFNEVKALVKEDLSFQLIADKINNSVKKTLSETEIGRIVDTSNLSESIRSALDEIDVVGEIIEKIRQVFSAKKLFNEVKAIVKEDLSFEVIANKIQDSIKETLVNTKINEVLDTSELSQQIKTALKAANITEEIASSIQSVFGRKGLFNEVKAIVKQDLSFEILANKIGDSVKSTINKTQIEDLFNPIEIQYKIQKALSEINVPEQIATSVQAAFSGKKLFNEAKQIVKQDLSFESLAVKIGESIRNSIEQTKIDNIFSTTELNSTLKLALESINIRESIAEAVKSAFGTKKLFNGVTKDVKQDLDLTNLSKKIGLSINKTLDETDLDNLLDNDQITAAIKEALAASDLSNEVGAAVAKTFSGKKLFNDFTKEIKQDLKLDALSKRIADAINASLESSDLGDKIGKGIKEALETNNLGDQVAAALKTALEANAIGERIAASVTNSLINGIPGGKGRKSKNKTFSSITEVPEPLPVINGKSFEEKKAEVDSAIGDFKSAKKGGSDGGKERQTLQDLLSELQPYRASRDPNKNNPQFDKGLDKAADKLKAALEGLSASTNKVSGEVGLSSDAIKGINEKFGKSFIGLGFQLQFIAQGFQQAIQAIDTLVQTASSFQIAVAKLNTANKSDTSQTQKDVSFVKDQQKQFGISERVGLNQLSTLKLSTDLNQLDQRGNLKQNAVTSENLNELQEAVNQVATATQLSAAETDSLSLVFSQVLSKGQVQSEEIKKQLSNVLPGAVGFFAKSQGVSGGELEKRLSRGEVDSSALVDFTKTLKDQFGDTAKLDTPAKSLKLFTAGLDSLLVKLSAVPATAVGGAAKVATGALGGLEANGQSLTVAAGVGGIAAAGAFGSGFIKELPGILRSDAGKKILGTLFENVNYGESLKKQLSLTNLSTTGKILGATLGAGLLSATTVALFGGEGLDALIFEKLPKAFDKATKVITGGFKSDNNKDKKEEANKDLINVGNGLRDFAAQIAPLALIFKALEVFIGSQLKKAQAATGQNNADPFKDPFATVVQPDQTALVKAKKPQALSSNLQPNTTEFPELTKFQKAYVKGFDAIKSVTDPIERSVEKVQNKVQSGLSTAREKISNSAIAQSPIGQKASAAVGQGASIIGQGASALAGFAGPVALALGAYVAANTKYVTELSDLFEQNTKDLAVIASRIEKASKPKDGSKDSTDAEDGRQGFISSAKKETNQGVAILGDARDALTDDLEESAGNLKGVGNKRLAEIFERNAVDIAKAKKDGDDRLVKELVGDQKKTEDEIDRRVKGGVQETNRGTAKQDRRGERASLSADLAADRERIITTLIKTVPNATVDEKNDKELKAAQAKRSELISKNFTTPEQNKKDELEISDLETTITKNTAKQRKLSVEPFKQRVSDIEDLLVKLDDELAKTAATTIKEGDSLEGEAFKGYKARIEGQKEKLQTLLIKSRQELENVDPKAQIAKLGEKTAAITRTRENDQQKFDTRAAAAEKGLIVQRSKQGNDRAFEQGSANLGVARSAQAEKQAALKISDLKDEKRRAELLAPSPEATAEIKRIADAITAAEQAFTKAGADLASSKLNQQKVKEANIQTEADKESTRLSRLAERSNVRVKTQLLGVLPNEQQALKGAEAGVLESKNAEKLAKLQFDAQKKVVEQTTIGREAAEEKLEDLRTNLLTKVYERKASERANKVAKEDRDIELTSRRQTVRGQQTDTETTKEVRKRETFFSDRDSILAAKAGTSAAERAAADARVNLIEQEKLTSRSRFTTEQQILKLNEAKLNFEQKTTDAQQARLSQFKATLDVIFKGIGDQLNAALNTLAVKTKEIENSRAITAAVQNRPTEDRFSSDTTLRSKGIDLTTARQQLQRQETTGLQPEFNALSQKVLAASNRNVNPALLDRFKGLSSTDLAKVGENLTKGLSELNTTGKEQVIDVGFGTINFGKSAQEIQAFIDFVSAAQGFAGTRDDLRQKVKLIQEEVKAANASATKQDNAAIFGLQQQTRNNNNDKKQQIQKEVDDRADIATTFANGGKTAASVGFSQQIDQKIATFTQSLAKREEDNRRTEEQTQNEVESLRNQQKENLSAEGVDPAEIRKRNAKIDERIEAVQTEGKSKLQINTGAEITNISRDLATAIAGFKNSAERSVEETEKRRLRVNEAKDFERTNNVGTETDREKVQRDVESNFAARDFGVQTELTALKKEATPGKIRESLAKLQDAAKTPEDAAYVKQLADNFADLEAKGLSTAEAINQTIEALEKLGPTAEQKTEAVIKALKVFDNQRRVASLQNDVGLRTAQIESRKQGRRSGFVDSQTEDKNAQAAIATAKDNAEIELRNIESEKTAAGPLSAEETYNRFGKRAEAVILNLDNAIKQTEDSSQRLAGDLAETASRSIDLAKFFKDGFGENKFGEAAAAIGQNLLDGISNYFSTRAQKGLQNLLEPILDQLFNGILGSAKKAVTGGGDKQGGGDDIISGLFKGLFGGGDKKASEVQKILPHYADGTLDEVRMGTSYPRTPIQDPRERGSSRLAVINSQEAVVPNYMAAQFLDWRKSLAMVGGNTTSNQTNNAYSTTNQNYVMGDDTFRRTKASDVVLNDQSDKYRKRFR